VRDPQLPHAHGTAAAVDLDVGDRGDQRLRALVADVRDAALAVPVAAQCLEDGLRARIAQMPKGSSPAR
jgi:hypothetical protein